MKIDLTGFNDKASRDPEALQIYEEADDYVSAYAAHTDLRVRRDGPEQAIGGKWETLGRLQLEFLVRCRLRRGSRLLDLGCGTGRFARWAVPHLDEGKYVGLDISPAALECARGLAETEGWASKRSRFFLGDGTLSAVSDLEFDYVWAHSVFTHLPPECIQRVFADLAAINFGVFYFTYKRADSPRRSGLKQFQYPPGFFAKAARLVGMEAEEIYLKTSLDQPIMRCWRP